MRLSPDQLIFWQHGFIKLNGTIVYTWGLMLVLAVGSKLITRQLSTDLKRARWQNFLEIVVTGIDQQIVAVGLKHPEKYIGFLGTLFLFVALAALATVIPGYEPPTGSLSTTAALALCVFVGVPLFGIEEQGFWGYLVSYTRPTVIMLPFNIISELSRTLALAVRLFGNMMSGAMIMAILLTITPFFFPIFSASWRRSISPPRRASASSSRLRQAKLETITNQPKDKFMDSLTIIAVVSIITAGLTIALGSIGPALGEGRAVSTALTALAQQPDASATITRTLFVGLAMIESIAIYCFVVSMILIFANPFWNHIIADAAKVAGK